jgi:hypothetical protein
MQLEMTHEVEGKYYLKSHGVLPRKTFGQIIEKLGGLMIKDQLDQNY